MTDQMIEQEQVEIILDRNPTNIVCIIFLMVIVGNYWKMQFNVKQVKRLKEINNGPTGTCNSKVSEESISDEDLDDFVSNFSKITIKLKSGFPVAGNSINCPNSDENEHENVYQYLK